MTRTRRRVAAVGALILVSVAPAEAQSLGLGGKVGMNLVKTVFEIADPIDVSAKPAVVGGGFVTFGLGARLSAEVDVYYSQRKSEFAEGDIVDTVSSVELPILGRFRVITREGWRVLAVGGAAISFVQKAEEAVSGIPTDIKAALKSSETAAVVGGQVEVGRRLVFDFRYLYGVTSVYKSASFPAKNRGYQITAGYRVR